MRLAAIDTFAGTRSAVAVARLEERVVDGTDAERAAAAAVIAESPSTRAATTFVELATHWDPEVRAAALAHVAR